MSLGRNIRGQVITLDVIAFIVLASAFAIYGLYTSAISLRDPAAAHRSLGPTQPGLLSHTGVITASLAAVGLFLTPWLAREGGYPAATIALVGVTVPLGAAMLSLRGWSMARLVGAEGLGDFFARCYGKGFAVFCGVLIAAAAVVLLAVVLVTAAGLVEALSSGAISQLVALHFAALFLLLSGAPSGIHAAGRLSRLHSALVLVGTIAACALVVMSLGGWDATIRALARVGANLNWTTTAGRGGGDYDQALAVVGAIGSGTSWTGTTILSVQIALAGTILMLVWLPRNILVRNPRRFTRQVGYGAAFGGGLLIATTYLLGLATLRIDRSPTLAPIVPFPGYTLSDHNIARVFDTIANETFWSTSALLGIGAGAALHALALSLLSTAVGLLHPIWQSRRTRPNALQRNLNISQGVSGAVIIAALLLAFLPAGDLALLAGLALSLAPLAIIPFATACWYPGATRTGLITGMIVGIVVVLGEAASGGVHAASAGLIAAALVTGLVSLIARRDRYYETRQRAQQAANQILAGQALVGSAAERQHDGGQRSITAVIILIWVFFAIGPGIVVGNDLFGAPDLPRSRWDFPIPSIAIWQLLAWVSGVGLVWFLASVRRTAAIGREQIDQITAAKAASQAGGTRTD